MRTGSGAAAGGGVKRKAQRIVLVLVGLLVTLGLALWVQADAVYLPVWLFGPGEPVQYGYEVVARYPHDPDAFTQGLVYGGDGVLYEGTGLWGASSLRRVDLTTGEVQRRRDLADAYFGEGIAVVEERIIQLTWKAGVAFTYDRETFELLGEHAYPGEGWGVTYDGERLIMSDGTSRLRFWDPETLAEIGSVEVLDGEDPITYLNELEYVEGQVWANVWQTDRIARIDADSGRVVGWIDLTGLLRAEDRQGRRVDVLNGIAYDADAERVFVTGKWWPVLYEIRVVRGG
ncbi:MAG TPA: glutaminyl-peptide cyclotransferase [Chloroflexi bacterium]|nr:glutaminyl-peptide cyclotransferase [Chloroflexota bacterium]